MPTSTIRSALLTLILSLAAALPLFADGLAHPLSLKLEHYSVLSGLPAGEVNFIGQDRNGFIWCATQNGLARFDGYEFSSFSAHGQNRSHFSSPTLHGFCEDTTGDLYLYGPKGVDFFDQHSHRATDLGDSLLATVSVKACLLWEPHKLLIGGSNGLYVYHQESGKVLPFSLPVRYGQPQPKNIRTLYKDSAGDIWIGTWGRGAYLLPKDSQELIKYEHPGLPQDLTVTAFTETQDKLWIGTWGSGLYCLSRDRSPAVATLTVPAQDPHNQDWNIIYAMDVDKNGRVWVGSPGGLRIVETVQNRLQEIRFVGDQDEYRRLLKEVHAVFCDRDGNLWLSCYGNGILMARYKQAQVQEWDLTSQGLPFSAVTAIHQDPGGTLWLGVRGIGLVGLDPATGQRVYQDHPWVKQINREANAIVSFVPTPDTQQVFLATRYDGIYQVRTEGGRPTGLYHYKQTERNRGNLFTHVAALDPQGNLWVGTGSGVVILVKDSSATGYSLYDPKDINDLLKWKAVEALLIDREGKVWIGSKELGLFALQVQGLTPVRSRVYDSNQGLLNDNRILSLYQDTQSRLWVGTRGGGMSLYQPQADRFEEVKNMHFFPSNEVNSITEDTQGNLWIATGNGFVYYDPDAPLNETINFGAGNDLTNLSFIRNAVFAQGDQIYFGGYNGLSTFHAAVLRSGKVANPPLITDVRIFNTSLGETRDWEQRADRLPPFTQRVRIGHRDKSINIRFASLNFGDKSSVKYAYRLEGLEKDWNYVPSPQRTVSYNNLKPGHYRFEVMASNNGSQWSQAAHLQLTVCPAPWLGPWAIAGYLLFACALATAYILFSIHIRQVQERQKARQEQAKTAEAAQAKHLFLHTEEPKSQADSPINTHLDKQFLDKAIRVVEQHLSDPDFNIEAFNAVMNMSNSTLYRKIKGLTGMPPKEFIRHIRFKYACKLLLEKTSSIADVAYRVGFADAKYFSLSFKKEFGMTPSDYIRSHRKTDENPSL